jgi:predicted lipid-binding transport protein (Tim44 family)
MNATLRLSIASLAVAAAALPFVAHAANGEASYELPQPAVSTLSRADVHAAVIASQAQRAAIVAEADAFAEAPAIAPATRLATPVLPASGADRVAAVSPTLKHAADTWGAERGLLPQGGRTGGTVVAVAR